MLKGFLGRFNYIVSGIRGFWFTVELGHREGKLQEGSKSLIRA